MPPPTEPAPSALLAREEEEWGALPARRSPRQETALAHARGRLRRLHEDFVHNLQVLEERDRELELYAAALAQARGLEEAAQAEVSALKVEAARLRQALAREAGQREDLQRQFQLELREHRRELARAHSDKNGELDQQRARYEELTRKLEWKLRELDGELAVQRQELLQEFESETQKRERDFQLQADSMSHAVLTHELQVKRLNAELAAVREAGAQAAQALQRAQTENAELQEQLQRGAQELSDLAAVKDARIRDLEGGLHSAQLSRQKAEETFRRKYEELDRLARERDTVLVSVKGAHEEQLRALEARVLGLQAQCETVDLQLRGAEWRWAGALQEKDSTIGKLQEEVAALKSGRDIQITQLSKDVTSKDLQVQSLREEEAKLKAQLARCQQDVCRYQRQLSLAAGREQSLEREKVQLGLDWQHRCASVERDQYRRSEELVQGLTAAREQAAAKLQEAERQLQEQRVALEAVTRERDQAVQELRARGLGPAEEAPVREAPTHRHREEDGGKSLPPSEVQLLREQNARLRDVVALMRTEMEALSQRAGPPALAGAWDARQPDAEAAAATTPDYVLALEAEIQNLKHKFKALEEQLAGVFEPPKVSSTYTDTQPRVDTSTAATGGVMPADGTSMGLALRKLADRAHLLNFLVARLRQKVLQEPLDVGTVQHELAHDVDQVHLEVLELRKQVAELQKHLGTAPQPPHTQQPPAPDTVALGREGPADTAPTGTAGRAAQSPQAVPVRRLQRKLQEATREIVCLRREKEQLLELGNRLRAELGRPAGAPRHLLPGREARTPGGSPEAASGRDPPLAQLQPCSTTQTQHKLSTATCRSASQKENRSPKPCQACEPHQDPGRQAQRASSLTSSSLQDTWKLLDLGSSPSGLTSQGGSTPELTAAPAAASPPRPDRSPVAIKGTKPGAGAKPGRPTRALPAKPKGGRQPPKIRNYNCKD